MIRSIVFVPTHDLHWMRVCAAYCAAHSYEIIAVAHRWRDAVKLINEGRATVLVAGRHDHLPQDREPRIEIVTDQQTTPVADARRRPKRRFVRRAVP